MFFHVDLDHNKLMESALENITTNSQFLTLLLLLSLNSCIYNHN